jgi:hypothetical protein
MRWRALTSVAAMAVAGALAGTALMVVIPAANATQGDEDARQRRGSSEDTAECRRGEICVYEDSNFRGLRLVDESTRAQTYGQLDDDAGSIINHSRETICFYEFENFRGESLDLEPDRSFQDMADWDDSISSHRPC